MAGATPTSGPTTADEAAERTGLASLVAPLRLHARWLLPFGLAVLLGYVYFVPAPAWNQNSRLALTRALVETRSAIIDESHFTTGDKSYRDGHFYSDKAPGVSWLSIPPYAVLYAVRRWSGGELPGTDVIPLDPRERAAGEAVQPQDRQPGDRLTYNRTHVLALWLCTAFAVAVPCVAAGAALFLLAFAATTRREIACWVALCGALATPFWPYATSLYGHALCGSLLIIAFAIVTLRSKDGEKGTGAAWTAGACLGAAVVTEYPAAVAAVAVVVLAWRRQGFRFASQMVMAGLPFALLLAAYHLSAFGHPLRTGYDFVYRPEFASGMAIRYGLGIPDPLVAWELLFGSYRGLFYLSPVLLLAAWGAVAGCRRGSGKLDAWSYRFALFVVLYFWGLNAGYYMWDGGAAAGPRHMVPALPFLGPGLAYAWVRVPRACAVLAVASGIQMLVLTAASPEAAQFGNPLWGYGLSELVGRSTASGASGTNVGALLGLPGPASLLPLLAVWGWLWPRGSASRSGTPSPPNER